MSAGIRLSLDMLVLSNCGFEMMCWRCGKVFEPLRFAKCGSLVFGGRASRMLLFVGEKLLDSGAVPEDASIEGSDNMDDSRGRSLVSRWRSGMGGSLSLHRLLVPSRPTSL